MADEKYLFKSENYHENYSQHVTTSYGENKFYVSAKKITSELVLLPYNEVDISTVEPVNPSGAVLKVVASSIASGVEVEVTLRHGLVNMDPITISPSSPPQYLEIPTLSGDDTLTVHVERGNTSNGKFSIYLELQAPSSGGGDFERKTWYDGESGGTPITAAELNRIEEGIAKLYEDEGRAVDSELSITSENPVQNKKIAQAFVLEGTTLTITMPTS